METSLSKPVQQASTVNKIVAWFFWKKLREKFN